MNPEARMVKSEEAMFKGIKVGIHRLIKKFRQHVCRFNADVTGLQKSLIEADKRLQFSDVKPGFCAECGTGLSLTFMQDYPFIFDRCLGHLTMEQRLQKLLYDAIRDYEQRRENLIKNFKSERRSLGASDPADSTESHADNELTILQTTKAVQYIRDCNQALLNIAKGEFGICVECGENIPEARLMIRPQENLCVACKTGHEKLVKMAGGYNTRNRARAK